MRKMRLLFLLSALALSATVASAAPMSFGLTGGMAIPTGDFGDAFDPGFSGGVYGDLWVKPTYSFGADIIGNFPGASEDAFGAAADDVSSTVIQFGLHGRWMPAMQSNMHPYLQYGAAMYNFQLDTPVGDDSSTDFGINGGAGLDFWSNASMKLGVGGMYHYVFTEDEATNYFGIGLNLTFLTSGTTMAGGQ